MTGGPCLGPTVITQHLQLAGELRQLFTAQDRLGLRAACHNGSMRTIFRCWISSKLLVLLAEM
jgi:hypothetical protein